MGGFSIYHWIILGIVVLVLFGGGGKISSLMGDFAKGIKSFKKNMAEDEPAVTETKAPSPPVAPIQNASVQANPPSREAESPKDASMAEETSHQSSR